MKKSYLGKPQILIRRRGGIVLFQIKGEERQFYILLKNMQKLAWTKRREGFAFGNVYVPHKTLYKLRGEGSVKIEKFN